MEHWMQLEITKLKGVFEMHERDYQQAQKENQIKEHPEVAEMREQAWQVYNLAKRQIAEVKNDRTLSEQGKKEKLDSISATFNPQITGSIKQAQKFYKDRELELRAKLIQNPTGSMKRIEFLLERQQREPKFLEKWQGEESEQKILEAYEDAVNLKDEVLIAILEDYCPSRLSGRRMARFNELKWNITSPEKKKIFQELDLLQQGRDLLGLMSWPTPFE